VHRNAPLTPEGRLRLCLRIEEDGWTVAAAAESMRISRQCAHKWLRRYRDEGVAGLMDRSSRPKSCPHQTPRKVELKIVRMRQREKLGPAQLSGYLGVPASTVHKVLVRHGLNRLAWMDRPTGRVIRRIETSRPGELVHIDVKKLARIPNGGGHKMLGRTGTKNGSMSKRGGGYTHVHSAVDAYSRLAYSEFAGPEGVTSCVAFLARAVSFFHDHGVEIERVLTDNGNGYRSRDWAALSLQLGIAHTRTRPYRPQTNGKVERFNRTLLDEWAYKRLWRSEAARAKGLDRFLHTYNHHRHHTAVGGPPISRVNNVAGCYS
jgi:transposase InsO family protein